MAICWKAANKCICVLLYLQHRKFKLIIQTFTRQPFAALFYSRATIVLTVVNRSYADSHINITIKRDKNHDMITHP